MKAVLSRPSGLTQRARRMHVPTEQYKENYASHVDCLNYWS